MLACRVAIADEALSEPLKLAKYFAHTGGTKATPSLLLLSSSPSHAVQRVPPATQHTVFNTPFQFTVFNTASESA